VRRGVEKCHLWFIQTFLKGTWIDLIKRWPSRTWKFLNKIWFWSFWNKEQLPLLKLFKIRDRIWIKIQGLQGLKFNKIWLGFLRIDEIWTRSSWLHWDDTSTHEKSLKFQIQEFLNFPLRIQTEIDLNFFQFT
jgi:hypothetical protein